MTALEERPAGTLTLRDLDVLFDEALERAVIDENQLRLMRVYLKPLPSGLVPFGALVKFSQSVVAQEEKPGSGVKYVKRPDEDDPRTNIGRSFIGAFWGDWVALALSVLAVEAVRAERKERTK